VTLRLPPTQSTPRMADAPSMAPLLPSREAFTAAYKEFCDSMGIKYRVGEGEGEREREERGRARHTAHERAPALCALCLCAPWHHRFWQPPMRPAVRICGAPPPPLLRARRTSTRCTAHSSQCLRCGARSRTAEGLRRFVQPRVLIALQRA
jgi:hypothetical protein